MTKTDNSIIVAHNDIDETIELVTLAINYDLTVEEMIEGLLYNDSDITSENFPNCKVGKTGTEEANLLLMRPVPSGQSWSTDQVLAVLDGAGFVQEELPALVPFKEHMDELYKAGVQYVTALGEGSRWRSSFGSVCSPFLHLDPAHRGFRLDWLEYDWNDNDWFVVRRKYDGI